jgi:hypothetical protein
MLDLIALQWFIGDETLQPLDQLFACLCHFVLAVLFGSANRDD